AQPACEGLTASQPNPRHDDERTGAGRERGGNRNRPRDHVDEHEQEGGPCHGCREADHLVEAPIAPTTSVQPQEMSDCKVDRDCSETQERDGTDGGCRYVELVPESG